MRLIKVKNVNSLTALIRTHISKKDKTLGRGEKGRRLTGESNLKKVGVEGLFKLRECLPVGCYAGRYVGLW